MDDEELTSSERGGIIASIRMTDTLDIVLLLRLSHGSGRDILNGFSTAVRRMRRRWRLHVLNAELDRASADLRSALANGADGVVANHAEPDVVSELVDTTCPVVLISNVRPAALLERPAPVAFVGLDNAAVGRAGADFLLSLGPLRSLAYIGEDDNKPRADAFLSALKGRHPDVRSYWPKVSGDADIPALAEWLRTLPLPAAAMVSKDAMALLALVAAGRAGLRVPKDLAVLGVDNDELLCETAEPPLTSIALDLVRLGELAAEAMRRMLDDPASRPPDRKAAVKGVVERKSARSASPAIVLASRAATYIRRNALKGIGAADVAAHLGASRSLVDQRVRQVLGESPLEMILRLRLDAVKAKLNETTLPIGQIVDDCGFGSRNHAMHLFKERFGCSMREWRRRSTSKWPDSAPRR